MELGHLFYCESQSSRTKKKMQLFTNESFFNAFHFNANDLGVKLWIARENPLVSQDLPSQFTYIFITIQEHTASVQAELEGDE
mmetsp:Transcript_26175/g.42697  ORF Transcript_26175/g.42697 Transcript_26175/m.42697 type:complete len:83 (+) Transcript_26175:170-418(+)